MDPLTTLLPAAAATGPNNLQSQALTALRSAGPQESFFTRMGNPHPLQVQQLAQPTTPQLNPIIAQPTSAPTAFPQQFPVPIMPLASPLADPAHTALHIPTLQAIHRMQQQASPAPAMMPMTPTTDLDQSHTQHHEGRDRRAVCPPRIAAGAVHGHSTDAIAKTDDPAATERAELTGTDQGPLGPDPQAAPAVTQRLSIGQATSKTSAPLRRGGANGATEPHQHSTPAQANPRSLRWRQEYLRPPFMDLTQDAATTQQQPPSRFRPNYTVDLSNTTNPPPPQVMVKPAVMLRRDERPASVIHSD